MNEEQESLPYSDHDTSKAAAQRASAKAPTLRERVFDFIKSRGDHGATDEEVEAATGLKHQTASARRNELSKPKNGNPKIRDSGRRRPTSSGSLAKVWVAIQGSGE